MFLLRKPTKPVIESFIKKNRASEFSYGLVGRTAEGLTRSESEPETLGYVIDHNRISIGSGVADLEKAKAAIRSWKMFAMPWVELCWPDTPIRECEVVGVLVRHFGFYSLNLARIVYVMDEPLRFGFAYGTLGEHGESGEERFQVLMDPDSEEVVYDLYAFSRPGHFLSKLGYPLARHLQKRFATDSKAAMARAVRDET